MKPLKIIGILGATPVAFLVMAGGAPIRTAHMTAPPDTLTIGAALAQAGYTGTPMRQDGGYRFVQANIGTTPVALRLDSGLPVDLFCDSSLAHGDGVHMTNVLSSYWTFTTAPGHWAAVDRLAVGATTLEKLEAKVEPFPAAVVSVTHAMLGATALMSRGAMIDYAADTLYMLSPHEVPASAPVQPIAMQPPTLRVALEQAGRYRTFLELVQRAGLMSLLDSTPVRVAAPDSVIWLGLRVRVQQMSGVGMMPPNDVHLGLARRTVDQDVRGPGRRTVFAPTDAAFAQLPAETLSVLRADTARLARLLRAHFYIGAAIDTVTMRTLIRGAARPGPAGPAFGFHVLGARIDVDRLTSWEDGRVVSRATIVQPDLRVAHGVAIAHGIDRVLDAFAAPSPFVAALTRQGYVGIPLHRREDGNGYLVQATVNNIPVSLTLETGAPVELALDQHEATKLPSSPGHDYMVMFDAVNVGSVHVDTADFSSAMKAVQRQGYRPSVGVVGSGFLAKYHARVDYAAGMLYLHLPAAPPAPTSH